MQDVYKRQPLVARAMVRAILDAVDGGVAQIDVRGSHVDLRAQHVRAFRELAVLHAQEQIHVFFRRAVAVRGVFARLGQRAAIGADLLFGKIVHIRQPAADEVERELVNLVVLLGGIVDCLLYTSPGYELRI